MNRSRLPIALAAAGAFVLCWAATGTASARPSATVLAAQTSASHTAAAPRASGVPFTADALAGMLPSNVFFQGKSAPLQLRNAAGTAFPGDAIVWAALVDTSGYSSGVQDKYQFYLVTEGPLHIGEASIPPGAYGGGFLGDHFVVMDIGGHTVAQGAVQDDKALRRPRPLELLPDTATSVKLYLGRHWVLLRAGNGAPR